MNPFRDAKKLPLVGIRGDGGIDDNGSLARVLVLPSASASASSARFLLSQGNNTSIYRFAPSFAVWLPPKHCLFVYLFIYLLQQQRSREKNRETVHIKRYRNGFYRTQ